MIVNLGKVQNLKTELDLSNKEEGIPQIKAPKPQIDGSGQSFLSESAKVD